MDTLASAPTSIDSHAAKRTGSRVALLMGMGLTTTFLIASGVIALMFTEGLLGIIGLKALLTANNLHLSLLCMYSVGPFALWLAGGRLGQDLARGRESRVVASARFSFTVSACVWMVFLITQLWLGRKTDAAIWAFGSLFMALAMGLLMTFTMGLLIATTIRQRLDARRFG